MTNNPAQLTQLPRWKIWMLAARIPTLPAAVVPVLAGTAAAFSQGHFRFWPFVAALIASLLIQIGTNFSNDLFDFGKGADTEERMGPVRVTQSGLLTEKDVMRGMIFTFGLAFLIGLYLVYIGGWPILVIGLLGIASGILYTGGPWPLGYHGLGDVFVFIFFGVVAVAGTYYLHTGYVDALAFTTSVPIGLLITAILVVNNLRDIDTDRVAGKNTLAVRLGVRGTRAQYGLFLVLAYLTPVLMWQQNMLHGPFWLPWLTLPLALRLIRIVYRKKGPALNAALKLTGQLNLWFGLLFAVSLLWP